MIFQIKYENIYIFFFYNTEIARDYFRTQGTHQVVGGIVSPTHDSYQKKGLVAGTHRFAMLKLALQSSTWIKVIFLFISHLHVCLILILLYYF